MTRPDVNILNRESAAASTQSTDTGVGHMALITEQGPDTAFNVKSLAEFVNKGGPWSTVNASAYNAVDGFFGEGGYSLNIARIKGASAAPAQGSFMDSAQTPVESLHIKAKGAGEFGNNLRPKYVVSGSGFKVQVTRLDTGAVIEESPTLVDKTAAILWSRSSEFIELSDGASTAQPAPDQTATLSGGLLDVAGVTDAQREDALVRLPKKLGPGQLAMPGATTDAQHILIDKYANATGRIAIKDAPDTKTVASLTAKAAASRSRFGAVFAPWVLISGRSASPLLLRRVPPSAIVMGILARNDKAGKTPSTPAAADNGLSRMAVDLSQPDWTDDEREQLNDGGVNVLINLFSQIQVYGWRTTADPVTDRKWRALGPSRLYMAISALADKVGRRFMFREVDGEGKTQADFAGALIGEALMPFFPNSYAGRTPQESFKVDATDAVNTPTTKANDELRASIEFVPSGMSESITIELVRKLITEGIN